MEFTQAFIEKLLAQAVTDSRLQQSFDLRTSLTGKGQCIKLNALQPGTVVPIHRHNGTDEIVFCLCGKLDVVILEEVVSYKKPSFNDFRQGMDAQDVTRKVEYHEVQRIHLSPAQAKYGCKISKGAWHTMEVIEPSVIIEAKGKYEEDGSERQNTYNEDPYR